MLTTYRSLFPSPFQMTAFVKLWRYPCPTDLPELFHSFGGEREDYYPHLLRFLDPHLNGLIVSFQSFPLCKSLHIFLKPF
jgi:hypothetical protein